MPAIGVDAEHACSAGELDTKVAVLRDALPIALLRRHHGGRIARRLHAIDALDDISGAVPEPQPAEIEGRWSEATSAWRELGQPDEQATAPARTGPDGLARAREIAVSLGARPLLARLDR